MRRIAAWFLATLSTVLLLFGYKTSTSSALPTAAPVAAPSGSATTGTPAAAAAGASAATAGTTVTGTSASTRWGPVQVQLTVSGGRITAVDVVDYPSGNHKDQEINADAIPTLVEETIAAQNANIDMVSGATVTSTGYVESLQSALDRAHLA